MLHFCRSPDQGPQVGLAPGHRRGDSRSELSKGRSVFTPVSPVSGTRRAIRGAPHTAHTQNSLTAKPRPPPPSLRPPLALLKGAAAPGTEQELRMRAEQMCGHGRGQGTAQERHLPRSSGLPAFVTTGQSKFSGIFSCNWLESLSEAETVAGSSGVASWGRNWSQPWEGHPGARDPQPRYSRVSPSSI